MKMLFRQRFFSWLDSYDIWDEQGAKLFTVKGQLSWGHCLKIFSADGRELGTVKERVLSFLPRFEIWEGSAYLGSIRRELSFFRPKYVIDFKGWRVEGSFMEWDYDILNEHGLVATISKELFNLTDTYSIETADPRDALYVLMFVLAMDAEKCSRDR